MNSNERIRHLRKTLSLTQQHFAEPLHMTQNTISSIESGQRAANDRLLTSISHCYGVSLAWLTHGEGPMFADFAAAPDADEDVRRLSLQFLKLSQAQRKVVQGMVEALLDDKQG